MNKHEYMMFCTRVWSRNNIHPITNVLRAMLNHKARCTAISIAKPHDIDIKWANDAVRAGIVFG